MGTGLPGAFAVASHGARGAGDAVLSGLFLFFLCLRSSEENPLAPDHFNFY